MLGRSRRCKLVCELFSVPDAFHSSDINDMVAKEVNHEEQFFFNLLCILELEHLLLKLKLDRALSQVLPRLAFLHILKLIEMPAESIVKFRVDFGLLYRVC